MRINCGYRTLILMRPIRRFKRVLKHYLKDIKYFIPPEKYSAQQEVNTNRIPKICNVHEGEDVYGWLGGDEVEVFANITYNHFPHFAELVGSRGGECSGCNWRVSSKLPQE